MEIEQYIERFKKEIAEGGLEKLKDDLISRRIAKPVKIAAAELAIFYHEQEELDKQREKDIVVLDAAKADLAALTEKTTPTKKNFFKLKGFKNV